MKQICGVLSDMINQTKDRDFKRDVEERQQELQDREVRAMNQMTQLQRVIRNYVPEKIKVRLSKTIFMGMIS